MVTILATTRTEGYVNSEPYVYLSIDSTPGVGSKTLDPSAANRIQLSSNTTVQGQMQANSTLKLWDAANHSLNLAEWNVSLEGALSGYPLALHVNSLTYSAGNITAGTDYYFTLETPGDPPPPPPPPENPDTVILLGDSITAQGGSFLNDLFPGLAVVNAGSSGATTGYTLSRIEAGEFDSYAVAAVVLMIGTNDVPNSNGTAIGQGVQDCVEALEEKMPGATIHLMSITHRFDFAFAGADANDKIDVANAIIAGLDGGNVEYLDLNADAGFANGTYTTDGIHLGSSGYVRWHDMLAGEEPNPPPPPPTSQNMTLTITVNGGSPVTYTAPASTGFTVTQTIGMES